MRAMIALLLLAACAAETDPSAAPSASDATDRIADVSGQREETRPDAKGPPDAFDPVGLSCGAGDYAGLIGKNLAAVTLPADLGARVIGPDTAVTQDYRPDRLNIHTDDDGTITELTCG